MKLYRVDATAEGQRFSFGVIVDSQGIVVRSGVRFARGAKLTSLQEWCLYGGHRLTELVVLADVTGKPFLTEI